MGGDAIAAKINAWTAFPIGGSPIGKAGKAVSCPTPTNCGLRRSLGGAISSVDYDKE